VSVAKALLYISNTNIKGSVIDSLDPRAHQFFKFHFFESKREDVDDKLRAVARSIYIYSPVTHTYACRGRLFCIPAHITMPSSAFRNEQHTRMNRQIQAFRSSIFHECTRNVFGCAEKADKHLAFWCFFFFFFFFFFFSKSPP
jgi:hypothetical protein